MKKLLCALSLTIVSAAHSMDNDFEDQTNYKNIKELINRLHSAKSHTTGNYAEALQNGRAINLVELEERGKAKLGDYEFYKINGPRFERPDRTNVSKSSNSTQKLFCLQLDGTVAELPEVEKINEYKGALFYRAYFAEDAYQVHPKCSTLCVALNENDLPTVEEYFATTPDEKTYLIAVDKE